MGWFSEARLPQPLAALRPFAVRGFKEAPAVAGALDEAHHGHRGQPEDVIVRELLGMRDPRALHAQPPGGLVHTSGAAVIADEEQLAIAVLRFCWQRKKKTTVVGI